MNATLLRFLVAAGLLFFSAATCAHAQGQAANRTPATPPATFQRTKARIDALLAQRLKPDPLPDDLPSPFQLPDSVVPLRENDLKPMTDRLPPTSDSELLLYYGAGLRISGTVWMNDIVHLVINQAPHKEGDTLTIKTKDATAKLRVIAIAPGELTLGLNEAVQIIKFKK